MKTTLHMIASWNYVQRKHATNIFRFNSQFLQEICHIKGEHSFNCRNELFFPISSDVTFSRLCQMSMTNKRSLLSPFDASWTKLISVKRLRRQKERQNRKQCRIEWKIFLDILRNSEMWHLQKNYFNRFVLRCLFCFVIFCCCFCLRRCCLFRHFMISEWKWVRPRSNALLSNKMSSDASSPTNVSPTKQFWIKNSRKTFFFSAIKFCPI